MDLWRVSIQITLHLIDLINCGALIHTHQSINYKHSDNLTKHEKFKYMAGFQNKSAGVDVNQLFFKLLWQVCCCVSVTSLSGVWAHLWVLLNLCSSASYSHLCTFLLRKLLLLQPALHLPDLLSVQLPPHIHLQPTHLTGDAAGSEKSPPPHRKLLKLQVKQSGGPSRAGTVPFKVKCLTV